MAGSGSHLRGSLLVLLAGVGFSFGALFFRWTDDIGPWEYLTTRAIGAVAVTGAFFWWQHRADAGAVVRRIEVAHVLAGVTVGTMFCIFIVALTETTAAFIVFFQAAAPIAAAVFSWFLLRERMSGAAVVATVITLVGVVIMVGAGVEAEPVWTIVIVAGIPIGLGLYSTLIRLGDEIDPSVPVIVGGLTALVLSVGVTLADGGYDASGRDLALGFLAGAVLLGLPLPVYNFASRSVPAPEATLLLMSEVVLAPIWVWLFVDETPSDATLVGGAVILGAVVWLTLRSGGASRQVRTTRG